MNDKTLTRSHFSPSHTYTYTHTPKQSTNTLTSKQFYYKKIKKMKFSP